ncbi:MAG: S8 family serine peptidase [Bifidobacterium sp.]|nr:S8 family serine peptidase [Bifidobacterium sp.]
MIVLRKRLCGAVSAACAMVVAMMMAMAPSASAADRDMFWYVNQTGVRDAWNAGINGEGVTVAVLDDPVVEDYPGFSAGNIEPRMLIADGETQCATDLGDNSISLSKDQPAFKAGATRGIVVNHGTEVAALVAGNGQGYDGQPGIQGVAPGAKVLAYVEGISSSGAVGGSSSYKCLDSNGHSPQVGDLIRDAVDSGARVVSMSFVDNEVADASVADFVYALAHGVILVSARDNVDTPGADDLVGEPTKNNYFPGAVTVNSIDSEGALAYTSDTKDGNVSILAPGSGVAGYLMTTDRKMDDNPPQGGTSAAAAILNGYLALVMQKWPKATGNQVLQSLVRNTKENTTGEATLDEAHKRGFGTADLAKLLATDPTRYPDINPLLEQAVTRSEEHTETKGLCQDHSNWQDGTWQYTDAFPYKIKASKSSDLVGQEYERQKSAWAKVEQCQKDNGSDCMQYSATATADQTQAYRPTQNATGSTNERTPGVAVWAAVGVGAAVLVGAGIVIAVVVSRRRRRRAMATVPAGVDPYAPMPMNAPAAPYAPGSTGTYGSVAPYGRPAAPQWPAQSPVPSGTPMPPAAGTGRDAAAQDGR